MKTGQTYHIVCLCKAFLKGLSSFCLMPMADFGQMIRICHTHLMIACGQQIWLCVTANTKRQPRAL
ncbi:MAG TPA: hypothetical protein DEA94_05910 [Rhodobacteraceae bacterium]|nr:hypothetical protein [Paracoccaceae bacterium]